MTIDTSEQLQLFEDQPIRTAWDNEIEEWYFSVVDVYERKGYTREWINQRLMGIRRNIVTTIILFQKHIMCLGGSFVIKGKS